MTNGAKEKLQNKTRELDGKKEAIANGERKQLSTQRALIFQGGGALAAYEVGVYAALYFWIKKDLGKKEKEDSNIFDIIAGTSGGAINASLIESHVMKNIQGNNNLSLEDCWVGSIKRLLDFYNHASSNPDYTKWGPHSIFGDISLSSSTAFPLYFYYTWKGPPDEDAWKARWDRRRANKPAASAEAARRYYSAKEYLYSGAPNVFSPSIKEYDNRFYDDFVMPTNVWYHYNNTPLKDSIKDYGKFPIATSFFPQSKHSARKNETSEEQKQEPQPRLLMVSVHVKTGAIITFDSYEKDPENPHVRKSESDDYTKEGKKETEVNQTSIDKIEMEYNCGIMPEHVIASSSVPINYDYAEVPLSYGDDYKPDKKTYKFWDGGLQSNTPLRELIQAHENYWNKVIDAKKGAIEEIPSLQVYIANIWPLRSGNASQTVNESNGVPSDHDGVKNRLYDLRLQDKTLHEEKVAYLIYDYIELAQRLKEKAEKSGLNISDILEEEGQSKHRDGNRRKYKQLLERKVKITEVVRFQREPDPDDISAKLYDYSSDTISQLIIKGVEETLNRLAANVVEREREKLERQGKKQTKKDDMKAGAIAHAKRQVQIELNRFVDCVEKEKQNERLTETIETFSNHDSNHEYNRQNYNILKGTNVYEVLIGSAKRLAEKAKL